MKDFIRVMKALSDPTRVRILKMLQGGEFCVCEVTDALKLAQSTVSKHLRLLEQAGLLTFRKSGQWVYYKLSNGSESPYAAVLLGNLKHWLAGMAETGVSPALLPDQYRRMVTNELAKDSNRTESR